MRILSLFFVAFFVITFTLSWFGLSKTRESVRDSSKVQFFVNPGGSLFLEADEGSVYIQAVDGNKVEIETTREVYKKYERDADKIIQDIDVNCAQQGDDVRVRADFNGRRGQAHLELRITVPRYYNVRAKSHGGGISVESLQGEVSAETVGGGLTFTRVQGKIAGETKGGGIILTETEGNADVHTSGGGIDLNRVKGHIVAETSGGGIKVDEVLGQIEAKTSGGSVEARISGQPNNDCQLYTSGGHVTVRLGEGVGVNLDARTSSGGRVVTDFPVTVQGELGSSVEANVNGGGPRLVLRTSGANIYLRKL